MRLLTYFLVGFSMMVILAVLVGCTREVVRLQSVPLYLPERPNLPVVDAKDMQCLKEPARERLFEREELLREHRVQLKAVVCSTWWSDKPCPKWEEWE